MLVRIVKHAKEIKFKLKNEFNSSGDNINLIKKWFERYPFSALFFFYVCNLLVMSNLYQNIKWFEISLQNNPLFSTGSKSTFMILLNYERG